MLGQPISAIYAHSRWLRCLLLLLLVTVCQTQQLSELIGLGEFSEHERKNCEFTSKEYHTCENCVEKGPSMKNFFAHVLELSTKLIASDETRTPIQCFYCGGTTERCLPYAWYFPGCELNDVRHNKCWVNMSAVLVVISVISGILLVIFLFCLCYCCCRCRAYNKAKAKKKGEKWNFQQELKRAEMQNRHSFRSAQRAQELEAYRIKYGLPTRMSPDGNPL
ncbi:hypothetical protein DICVIV_05170 [Dictyocaulus viviparus]|uniref:Uncharacterized protein n=1 Tax=Dictyocaulus viviparus TaxID=29172 RepID=A0A0D8XY93_DICVI|nr:hypothetical protein DICVIV_05170 [Dictyocaulus viviparus]